MLVFHKVGKIFPESSRT